MYVKVVEKTYVNYEERKHKKKRNKQNVMKITFALAGMNLIPLDANVSSTFQRRQFLLYLYFA
jgi:predicted 3-demethylubiquinone-9 3-methyltransferase (glyoxalase superfamily)